MNKILLVFTFIAYLPVCAQPYLSSRDIQWHQPGSINETHTEKSEFDINRPVLFFNQANVHDKSGFTGLPVYYELLFAPDYYPDGLINITDPVFERLKTPELATVSVEDIDQEIKVEQRWVISRGEPALEISFVPLRLNPVTGVPEKLTSFSFRFSDQKSEVKQLTVHEKRSYTSNSVLSSGKWVKIKTKEDGIYRLTYDDLINMGLDNPANVRIFGNGNRMLPKMNYQPRQDDLVENKIYLSSGPDGTLGPDDYVLFYGQGPVSWDYNAESGLFEHELNLYSDGSYYFITSTTAGKSRIGNKTGPNMTPGIVVNEFDDYDVYKKNDFNLLKSGRKWFSDHFKVVTSGNYTFRFDNIVASRPANLSWSVAARSPVSTSFRITHNSGTVDQINLSPVNLNSVVSNFANIEDSRASFAFTGDIANLTLEFTQNTPSSEGWLDYLLINVRRSLIMSGSQMHFRDTESVSDGQVSEFRLTNPAGNISIWDITDPVNIMALDTEVSGNVFAFADETSRLNQYIAFRNDNYLKPEVIGPVNNQNLHGIKAVDMVIVAPPDFMSQANQLARHRIENDGMTVVTVTPEQLYNEFASGKPDLTAIRDFMKMLYDRAVDESDMPRYLLLFGNGAYDNRPGNPSGINFVPTYQSPNSIRPTQSFVSDDYFGLLDDQEGEYIGLLDIGIGRFPVTTQDQAQAVVNKVINYNKPQTKGDWQNIITFIADDGDNNLHMRDSDILARSVKENYPVYNLDKIYLDAWPKIGTSLGQRYPGVNEAIEERIRKGALLINYTGHGNELRLADENIIDINDVVSWTNHDRLPVFMTATCEFSRFDNTERVSAGEMLFLNPNGGSIALFSTTRLVYATPNFFLNQNFSRFVLEKNINGKDNRLGDIMRLTKINTGAGINKRNFTLLGDPSMKLAIPEHRIIITSINEQPVTEIPDTLRALSKVSMEGRIVTSGNSHLNNFGGMVYHTVYDKELQNTTMGNDGATPFSYSSRTNVIYKGKASITNGSFSFSFIVPKDIAYYYGTGKISSFAKDGNTDAAGYYDEIIIGGSNPDAISDTEGPEIELFMNDRNFVSGGITGQNPTLLAFLSDSSGINTVGSGIGHDITLILNNDPITLVVLNDYYLADADSYQKGTIEYPFSELDPGKYNINLKAWDVFNNSSETSLDFTVTESDELALNNVFNYPNPFTQNTFFHFEHNQPDTGMDVLIQIFTVSGRLVKTIDTYMNTTGFKPDPIPWDGLDDYGDKIGRGVYIYRIRIRTPDGRTAEKYEKLVILK